MEDIVKITSIVSCIFAIASYCFIIVLFYKVSNLDELFDDIKKRNADRYEFFCIKENESDHIKWFKNGNSLDENLRLLTLNEQIIFEKQSDSLFLANQEKLFCQLL